MHPTVKLNSTFGPLISRDVSEIGFRAGINYSIRLGEHFRLVTGLAYSLLRQDNIKSFVTSYSFYYSSQQGGQAETKVNNHCLLPSLGLRWLYKKISFENGIGYMYLIKRPGTVTDSENNFSFSHKILAEKKPAGFLQSYHKIGLNVNSHIGIYFNVNLIYAKKAVVSSAYYTQYYYVPVTGLQVQPGLSVALKL